MSQIVFATRNDHKIQEFNQILRQGDFATYLPKIIGLEDINCFEELEETSPTIEGNAIQKAKYVATNYDVDCFAEDTGLEVFALNNAPGVHSARYAGNERDAIANMNLVLNEMSNKSDRRARFKTVIALFYKNKLMTFTGIANGSIRTNPKGSGGFGYDPIFIPTGYNQTFAEMSSAEKNYISHRSKAIEKLIQFLESDLDFPKS